MCVTCTPAVVHDQRPMAFPYTGGGVVTDSVLRGSGDYTSPGEVHQLLQIQKQEFSI